jgi:phosphatidylserine decarboxylase
MNEVYDRKNKNIYVDKIPKSLIFLYKNNLGRIILRILITKPVTMLGSVYMKSFLSKIKIKHFIKKNNINMNEYDKKNYPNFNAFFTRTIKDGMRVIDSSKSSFIAPADSKLSVYTISKDLSVDIKNSNYTITELIEDNNSINEYINGLCLIFRLAVDDYHHYCFPDDGHIEKVYEIQGVYHTVNPIAINKYKVYHRNHRIVNFIDTNNFGKIIDIEVGALMVGKIVNNDITNFKKGQEKGYFCFGGSTIVLLVQENKIKLDNDIYKFVDSGIEIKVKYGEKIGKKVD